MYDRFSGFHGILIQWMKYWKYYATYIFSLNPDRLSGSNDITSDKLNFRPDIRHFFSKKSGHQEFVSLLKQFVATLPW